MLKLAVALLAASICPGVYAGDPDQPTLTNEERVSAQRKLDRVDVRRRIDVATTAALATYWNISPTDEMLERELRRLAGVITPPERLAALYETLDDDPFLIRECLARPALIERMSRDLYAFDPAFHRGARAEAVELRRRLVSGELSAFADYPGRSVFELPPRRAQGVGQVSPIADERDGFELSVVLSEAAHGVRVAKYVVPKTPFETWLAIDLDDAPPAAELFSSCAVAGSRIDLLVEEDLGGQPETAPATALMLDVAGEPLVRDGATFTAPYTGVYFAQVARNVAAGRGAYVVTIGGSGGTGVDSTADLFATTIVAPTPAPAGGFLTYTITIHNAGPDPALNAEMLLTPPDPTTYDSIVVPDAPDGRWDCTTPTVGGRGKISCTKKCFAPGTSATFTITLAVEACLGSTPLTSKTTASSVTIDPDPLNNVTFQTTPMHDLGTCDDGNLCTAPDRCTAAGSVVFQEAFDGVAVPLLPAGWTATLVTGPDGARTWRTIGLVFDTEPNSVFTVDASDIRDSVLDSPAVLIESAATKLRFRNRYDLERDNDGGVLEIRIGTGPFEDILSAGGSFAEGGYNGTISESFGSPISGRQAWTGLSNGFVPTTVNLPAAAVGESIVLRWRMATDRSLGKLGQWIDSVLVTDQDVCEPGIPVTCDDSDACTNDACDLVFGCEHAAVSCDDGNGCTDDACDPVSQCVHTDNAAPCDDHNACTLSDACAAGACVGATAVVCHDADSCTADTCDPTILCVSTTANFDASGFSLGRIDGRDLAVLADAWSSCIGSPRYDPAVDLDRQGGCIDLADFHLFMESFGRTCSP